jgi:hypothetical protein
MNVRIVALVVLGVAILVNICLIPSSAWKTLSGWELPKITLFMLAAATTYLLAHWLYSDFEIYQKEISVLTGKKIVGEESTEKNQSKAEQIK